MGNAEHHTSLCAVFEDIDRANVLSKTHFQYKSFYVRFELKNREYFNETKKIYCSHCNKVGAPSWEKNARIIIYKVTKLNKKQIWKTVNLETFYDILERLDKEYAVHYAAFTINQTEKDSDMHECMICMEQPANVTLPCCANSFCDKCLNKWNVFSQTCPTCRKTSQKKDRESVAWVNVDVPYNREQIVRMTMIFIQRAPAC